MAMLGNQLFFDDYNTSGSSIVSCTVGSSSINMDSMRSVGLVIDDDMASCAGFGLSLPTVTIAASPNPACAGQPMSFTATTAFAGTSPKFQWLVNGAKAGTDSPSFSYIPADGDTVQCRLTSNDFCASQVTATSNAVITRVLPYATPGLSLSASDTGILCPGTTVLLTANPGNAGNAPTYQWYKNGIPIAAGTTNTYTEANPRQADSFYAVVRSSALCNTVDTARSAKLGIRIGIPTPAVSLSVLNPAPLCSGTSITIQASAAYPGSTPTYTWTRNGIPWTGSASGSSISSRAFGNGDTIALTMRSAIACASPKVVSAAPLILQIRPTVVPGCNIDVLPGTALCQGSPITFVTNTTGGGTAPQYDWMRNGSPWPAASGGSYTAAGLSDGDSIYIRFTSSETCASPPTVSSNKLGLRLEPLVHPAVAIEALSGTDPGGGLPLSFRAHSQWGGPQPAFQWLRNGVQIPFATDSAYTSDRLLAGDQLGVQLISSERCPAAPSVTAPPLRLNGATGIGRTPTGDGFAMFPNPSTGCFTIALDRPGLGIYAIQDVPGRDLYSNTIDGSNTSIVLPGSIAAGIYVVRVILTDGRRFSGKIVVR